jgi:hypothetical protein
MTEDNKNPSEDEDDQEGEDADLNNLKDDLKTYLEEMKTLETDFSDMDDLDFEEIQAMQNAVDKMRDIDALDKDIPNEPISKDMSEEQQEFVS